MAKTNSDHGVTLIEILVAISLLVVIGGSCFVAYRSAMETLERGEARVQRIQSVRAAFDIISRELSAAFIQNANNLYRLLQNDDYGMYFTTTQSIYSLKGGTEIYRVGYQWDNTNKSLLYWIYPNENSDYPLSDTWSPRDTAQSGRGGSEVLISKDIGCEVTGIKSEYGYYANTTDRNNGKISWRLNLWDSSVDNVNDNINRQGIDKNPDRLPEIVRIGLTVIDAQKLEDAQDFYTIICLPNVD